MDIKDTAKKALELYRKQDYQKSKQLSLKILQIDSFHLSSWVNLGNICFQKGEFKEAISHYKKALQISPENYILGNIANAYLQLKQYWKVWYYCKRILRQDSENIFALNLLVQMYMEREKNKLALPYLERLKKLDSKNPWVWNNLSQVYFFMQEYTQSLKAAHQAVSLAPEDDLQHINMGYALYETALEKGTDFIKKEATNWFKKYGKNPIVKYFSDSLKHNKKITKTDATYLRKIFDSFSESFEDALQALNYGVPQKIIKNIQEIFKQKQLENMTVLDMGCGTGLCGKYMTKYARPKKFIGVDLSAGMLQKAQEKNVYNQLVNMDIEEYLQDKKEEFDLVIAADVLTYFGRLDSLFNQIANSMKKSGVFIFSVTQNPHSKEDYFLHLSGRFHHHADYIAKCLQNSQLELLKMYPQNLRSEGGKNVEGWIVIAQK